MSAIKNNSSLTHGGSRKGAGRKPSTIRGLIKTLPKDTAELILLEINANQRWVELLSSEDEHVVLRALMYLTDRAYGRAREHVEIEGRVEMSQGDVAGRIKQLEIELGYASAIDAAATNE